MKKTVLVLSLFFTSGLAYAAGGPIPGVDVSLERIPGGIYHTKNDCLKKGGKIIHKHGKIFCESKRMTGVGPVDNSGDFTLKMGNEKSIGNAIKRK